MTQAREGLAAQLLVLGGVWGEPVHTTASEPGACRGALAESCRGVSDPLFEAHYQRFLEALLLVLYGKERIKLGSKASLEHTRFGCPNLITVTVTQPVL